MTTNGRGAGRAAVLMVQGTASGVGKSVVVTGLCRHYARRGLRVKPFKAQNIALNSYVTRAGHEIGRAQAVQAEAAGVPPAVEMNPILIKPVGDGAQVVFDGRPLSKAQAHALRDDQAAARNLIAGALESLRASSDLVILEGAGNPAEPNLRERDLVNMHVARLADAPVLLVGGIDRGGVFAQLSGTLEWLEPDDRARVRGFLINKLHGDPGALGYAPRQLEERTGRPVVGVLPHLGELHIAEEDSVAIEERLAHHRRRPGELELAVLALPHIANYDDFVVFEREEGVSLRFVRHPSELVGAPLVILPGSKDTRADLEWLRAQGFERALRARAARSEPILGVCAGFQMLGRRIEDPLGIEGPAGGCDGLDLLPVHTVFRPEKRTAQVRARSLAGSPFGPSLSPEHEFEGYEIHHGEVLHEPGARHWFERVEPCEPMGEAPDPEAAAATTAEGCWHGSVAGTLLHGLFYDADVRRDLLRRIGWRSGSSLPPAPRADDEYERLADALEASLDLSILDRWIGLDR